MKDQDLVFITGNQHKADFLARYLGHPVAHHKLDLDEIQSLDVHQVAEHKARQAYDILKQTVLIEDATMSLEGLGGKLPGTYIKWFMEELGPSGVAKLAAGLSSQKATGHVVYALYDGKQMHFFDGTMTGYIAPEPRGSGGFGFDPIFVNDGYQITRGEMTEEQYAATSYRTEAMHKLKAFLNSKSD